MDMLTQVYNPRPLELNPLEGVAWGNQATMRIISGPTYQNIELVTNITNAADIERVRITLNGKEIIGVTGKDLVSIQKHRKQYVQSGRYIVPFSDLSLRTKAGVRTGELVTLQGEMWMMYIQLKAKAGSAQAPTIRARAHTTAAQMERFFMPRLFSLTWSAPATGRTPFDWAERTPFLTLKRVHFKDPTIERVRILRDNREEMNVSKPDNAYDLAVSGLEQNTDWFSLDFIRTGFGVEGRLPTSAVSSLSFELDKTEAGPIPVLIEAIEQVAVIQGA